MKINIQFIDMPTSAPLESYTSKKLLKLDEKYSSIIRADIYFKKENDPNGKNSTCEITLSIAGPRLFASATEIDYKMAVKQTIKNLIKQLKKRKETLKPYL